jgi:hypothetical protein
MVDINQRSLWKDPYWKQQSTQQPAQQPAPQGYANGGRTGNQYANQYQNPYSGSSVITSAAPSQEAQDIASTTRLPSENLASNVAGGIGELYDSAVGYAKDNVGQQRDEASWLAEMDENGDKLGRVAIFNLKKQGKELSNRNVNMEIKRLTDEHRMVNDGSSMPTSANPVGANDNPDITDPTGIEAALANDKGKTGAGSSTSVEMNYLANEKQPDETLEAWAERIGINLKGKDEKAYSNWDYIGDMSAALLSAPGTSDNSTTNFLSALGAGSTAVNEGRKAAESTKDKKRTSLALAKWQSDDAWEKFGLKQDADLKAAQMKALEDGYDIKMGPELSRSTDRNGTDVAYTIIKKGWENLPSDRVTTIGGKKVLISRVGDSNVLLDRRYKNIKDLDGSIIDAMQSDFIEDKIVAAAQNIPFKGEMLASWRMSDEGKEILADIQASTVKGAEGYAEALEAGDFDAAFDAANALAMKGAVGQSLSKAFYTGMLGELSPGDNELMRQAIRDRALESGRAAYNANPENPLNAVQMIEPSINYQLENMHWDKDGLLKFATEAGPSTINNWQNFWGGVTGDDRSGDWFSSFNVEGFPDTYKELKKNGYDAPFNRPDEMSIINKDQWELLSENQKQQVEVMSSTLATDLTRNHSLTEEQSFEDITTAIIDSNSIHGGEDVWGWNNTPARLDLPKKWQVEPTVTDGHGKVWSRDQLRENNIKWNGFKGEFFAFKVNKDKRPERINYSDHFRKNDFRFDVTDTIDL